MLALVVSVHPVQAEVASDVLWSLGVVAVEERLGSGGQIELWTSLGDDRRVVERAMVDTLEPVVACSWRLVEIDEEVADSWRDHATPTWVAADLVIVPAWLPTPDHERAVTVIAIEPGATFGAGDHPTTVLSLRALRRAVEAHARHTATVLDVGCGSGVLAVGAVRLGAAHAVGIDISPAAVPVTTANAERNDVAGQIAVSTMPLADVDGTFDVVVANILAPALIDLADDLVRVLAPHGVLIISGVLEGRFDHVVAALAPLRTVEVDELDGWVAVTLWR